MIKVNLLRDQTLHVRKVSAIIRPEVSRMGLVSLVVFVLLLGGLGAWWYMVDHEVGILTATRNRLRVENERLKEAKKQLDRFEKLKQLQQSRIAVIEKLMQNQTGPVQLMNILIRSIPPDATLWLTLLDQKGERIQIAGYTLRNESVPGLMSNLAATGYFKSVDLELLESEKEASKFSLICISAQKQPGE